MLKFKLVSDRHRHESRFGYDWDFAAELEIYAAEDWELVNADVGAEKALLVKEEIEEGPNEIFAPTLPDYSDVDGV